MSILISVEFYHVSTERDDFSDPVFEFVILSFEDIG